MKVLVTLDFPPETGGIQRYLHNIVVHTFSEGDLVVAGKGGNPVFPHDEKYPCRIIRTKFPGDAINKKILLIPLLWRMVRLVRETGTCTVFAGNVYAALVPWLISMIASVKYRVFCLQLI